MRLSAKSPIILRGDEITHSDADGSKHLPRAASLPDGKILATSGGAWKASDLSGVSVSSVFGRTGAVAAQTGDYTAAQVGAEPYAGVPAQASFWRSTAAGVRAWVQLVAADITDLATTLAGYLPIANPDFTGALKQGGVTRITSGGVAWLASVQATNLVGAGDRPVAADLTGTLQPKTPDQFRNMIFALASSLKGAANGVAELGADGRVPTTQLPSYVDDVLEYANLAAFPATGETGKIYINLDQNKTWRWSGSGYTEISASLALGETSATAYRGDRGKTAYDHSQATGNPHGTTAADVGAMETANPVFTGALKQGGTTRITSGGGTDFASLRVSNLSSAFNGVLTSDYVGVVGVRGAADFRDDYIQAAAADHNHDGTYLPLAGAEILIHSDFGRSATTGVWQSAFTNNAASGLQFPANSIASGTKIVAESLCYIPADSGGIVEVCIGPQLTGDASPTGSTYAIVLTPGTGAGEGYGNGILRIEIELIGSGSAITGYVVASFLASGQTVPVVATGSIEVDGTLARTLDLRFNPFGTTSYVFRRNRVFRRNP